MDIQPLRALHYNLEKVGSLQAVTAPPYDVIDKALRSQLLKQSPYNVVEIDLPQGDNPYKQAAKTFTEWIDAGVLEKDSAPAYWLLTQTYTTPDGRQLTRHGVFARVRVCEYAQGKIRPHERTHAGPKEDRLKLTRATRTNLSPIFSLYSDPDTAIWQTAEPATRMQPWAEVTDRDGTVHRLWRLADRAAIAEISELFADKELLIADGHHRYETALTYAREIGGEGPHNYTMMCLVAMEDPGMTVFPTHRLVRNLDRSALSALEQTVDRYFEKNPIEIEDLASMSSNDAVEFGFIDRNGGASLLTLKSQKIADDALAERVPAYRELNTAILEKLVLIDALGRDQEELSKADCIRYSKDVSEAVESVRSGKSQAAFVLNAAAMEQIQAIAQAGETMPPKSTYFFPKLLSGMLFSPLGE